MDKPAPQDEPNATDEHERARLVRPDEVIRTMTGRVMTEEELEELAAEAERGYDVSDLSGHANEARLHVHLHRTAQKHTHTDDGRLALFHAEVPADYQPHTHPSPEAG